jgi:hypothetical protein
MARKSKALALHLLRTVYNATDRPMQWRSIEGLDAPESTEALRYAVEKGWILLRNGHSVCLTKAGRRLIGPVARPIVKTAGLDEAADSSNATAAAAKCDSLTTLRSRLDARHARPGGGANEALRRSDRGVRSVSRGRQVLLLGE